MKRHHRRIITRVIVFLLLGAIVTVAVAWGCVLTPRTQLGWPTFAGDSEFEVSRLDFLSDVTFSSVSWRHGHVTIAQELKNWPGTVIPTGKWMSRPTWAQIEPSIGHPLLTELIPADSRVEKFVETAAGWPLLATYGSWTADNNWFNSTIFSCHGILNVPRTLHSSQAQHYLPVIPVWPGFAINTIFYAAILWMSFAFPFVVRRRRRIKRGLCPACAYPVGTSPVCTECGKAVMPVRAG